MKKGLIYVLLLTCIGAQSQNPFLRVRSELDNNEFVQTKRILDSCFSTNFQRDSALYYKGMMQLRNGKLKDAKKTSAALKKEFPSFNERYFLEGIIFFTEENYGKCIDAFNSLIKSNPSHVKAIYNRSVAFGMLEEYLSAIEDLGTVISLKPQHANAYYSRAYWYEYTGNYAEALKDYEMSIQLDPKNFDAYYGMAFIYQNNREPSKACETIQRAVAAGSQIAEDLKENYCR